MNFLPCMQDLSLASINSIEYNLVRFHLSVYHTLILDGVGSRPLYISRVNVEFMLWVSDIEENVGQLYLLLTHSDVRTVV